MRPVAQVRLADAEILGSLANADPLAENHGLLLELSVKMTPRK